MSDIYELTECVAADLANGDIIAQNPEEEFVAEIDTDSFKTANGEEYNQITIEDSYRLVAGADNTTKHEYSIPQTTLESLWTSVDSLRQSILDNVAGMETAIINTIDYSVSNSEGIIRQELDRLNALYISTGMKDEFALTSELSQNVIARQYVIDRWTGLYVQDREDWGSDQDDFLTQRWAYTSGADADNNGYSLAEIPGTLGWIKTDDPNRYNDNETDTSGNSIVRDIVYDDECPDGYEKWYHYNTVITSQDIYDKIIRVEHNQASYTEDLRVLVDKDTELVEKTEHLQVQSDISTITLDTMAGVMLGTQDYYLYNYPDEVGKVNDGDDDTIGVLPTTGQLVCFEVVDDTYTLRTDVMDIKPTDIRYEYTGTLDDSLKPMDGWLGWQITAASASDTNINTIQSKVNILQQQLDKEIDSWFQDNDPFPVYEDATNVDDDTKLTSDIDDSQTALRQYSLVLVDSVMYQYLDTDDRDNVDMTAEDYSSDKYRRYYKDPEIEWRYSGTDDTDSDDVLKNRHTGDLFYNSISGQAFRYVYKEGEFYWEAITDTAITKALSAANSAQATADGKMAFFTGSDVPTYAESEYENAVGDVWVPTDTIFVEYDNGDYILKDSTYVLATDDEKADDDIQKYYRYSINTKYVFTKINSDSYMWLIDSTENNIAAIITGDVSLANATINGVDLPSYMLDPANTGTTNMIQTFTNSGMPFEDDNDTIKSFIVDKGVDVGDIFIDEREVTSSLGGSVSVLTSYKYKGLIDDVYVFTAMADPESTKQLMDLTDGKRNIYNQAVEPKSTDSIPPMAGDMWYKTDTNELFIYTDDSWQNTNLNTALKEELETQIDSKVVFYHQDDVPEDDHITGHYDERDATSDRHIYDLWTCTKSVDSYEKGSTYKYTCIGNDDDGWDYSWELTDDILSAIAEQVAETTVAYYLDHTPTTNDLARNKTDFIKGDMWIPTKYIDGYNEGKIYVYNDGTWVDGSITYTDDTVIEAILAGTKPLAINNLLLAQFDTEGNVIEGTEVTFGDAVRLQSDSEIDVYSGSHLPGTVVDGETYLEVFDTSDDGYPYKALLDDSDIYIYRHTVNSIISGTTESTLVEDPYVYSESTERWYKSANYSLADLADYTDDKRAIYSSDIPTNAALRSSSLSTIGKLATNDILIVKREDIKYLPYSDCFVSYGSDYSKQIISANYINRLEEDIDSHDSDDIVWALKPSNDKYCKIKYSDAISNKYKVLKTNSSYYQPIGSKFSECYDDISNSEKYAKLYDGQMFYWDSDNSTTTIGDVAYLLGRWVDQSEAEAINNDANAWVGGGHSFVTGPNREITGWSYNDGSDISSEFVIRANTFKLQSSDGNDPITPFKVEGSNTYFNGIVTFSNVIDEDGNDVTTKIGDAESRAIQDAADKLAEAKAAIEDTTDSLDSKIDTNVNSLQDSIDSLAADNTTFSDIINNDVVYKANVISDINDSEAVIDGGRISANQLVIGGELVSDLSNRTPVSDASGMFMDKNGISIFNNGIEVIRLGKL